MQFDLSSLAIVDTKQGCVFAAKVVPSASRDRLVGVLGDALKVTVTCPPEKGAANKALLKLLGHRFQLQPGQLQIIGGQTQPRKRILAVGISGEELRNRWKTGSE